MDSGYTAKGRIYKNGVAYGTERTTTSTSFVGFTEDLTFVEGDTLELWICNSGVGKTTEARNFRVLGIEAQAYASDPFVATNS